MEILKNAGTFEILSKTEDVITSIATAARTCYQSQDKASPENDYKLVKLILDRGHHAMIEFADMTVCFINCSRGMSHELVRHRLCSLAQESTRYVDESDFNVVVPPHKNEESLHNSPCSDLFEGIGGRYQISLSDWLEANERMYRQLRLDGWKSEDARQSLPTAIEAEIVLKANLREWRHIFSMRCDKFAHWEIRSVMLKLLKGCKKLIPLIFDDFHFFEVDDAVGEYSRPIPSAVYLKDLINHFCYNDHQRSILKDIIASV